MYNWRLESDMKSILNTRKKNYVSFRMKKLPYWIQEFVAEMLLSRILEAVETSIWYSSLGQLKISISFTSENKCHCKALSRFSIGNSKRVDVQVSQVKFTGFSSRSTIACWSHFACNPDKTVTYLVSKLSISKTW